jgi:hypothetical protein
MSIYFVYTKPKDAKGETIAATYSEFEYPEARAKAALLRAQLTANGQASRVVSQEASK